MPAVLSDPVTDVVTAVDKLRVDDRLITSADVLVGDIEALLDAVTGLQAVLVRRLRAARDAEATSEVAGRSPRAFLTEDLLLARGEAAKLIRLTYQLPACPLTEAAFDTAQISLAHAVAITRALRTLPAQLWQVVEPHLVERAKFYPPEEIAAFVDELLEALGIDKAGDIARERRHSQRGVDLTPGFADASNLSGTLTPEVAEDLQHALALAGADRGSPDDDRTPSQRRHDALGVIAAAYLANSGVPAFNGSPRTMIVTIDLDTLEGRLRDAWIALPSGATIHADTARRLACNAHLVPAVLGGTSEILDLGQTDSEFTTAIRRAAYLRDHGRCAFPHCRNPVTQLHHITWRSRQGPTSLDNAAWLCHYHHWLAHDGHWTLRRQPDGSYLWTSPHGRQRTRDPRRE